MADDELRETISLKFAVEHLLDGLALRRLQENKSGSGIESADPTERKKAVHDIGGECDRSGADRLVELLFLDPDPSVRVEAALALKKIIDPKSFPHLGDAKHDMDWEIQKLASEIHHKIKMKKMCEEIRRDIGLVDKKGIAEKDSLLPGTIKPPETNPASPPSRRKLPR